MGFKDGTANIKLEDAKELADHVWVGNGADEPAWLRGGSYLVARRIRMLIEVWDRAALGDQEQTIGRTKVIGAPLGGTDEFQTLKPKTLPVDSHVRLAHPEINDGTKILRRGYSFTDGLDVPSASSTPASSSWPTCATPRRSSRCRTASAPTTRSTSTSSTSAPASGRSRPASSPAATSAKRCCAASRTRPGV